MIIKLDGSLYTVVEFGENKTARAAAKVWAKLKGVDNSRSIEKTWNSGDTIYPVRVERKAYQYLYKDDSGYNFMDNETFEQIALQEQLLSLGKTAEGGQAAPEDTLGIGDAPGFRRFGLKDCKGLPRLRFRFGGLSPGHQNRSEVPQEDRPVRMIPF